MAFRTVIDGIGAVTESSPGVFTTTGIIAEDITSLANDTLGGPGVVGGMQVSATSPASNQVSISAGKAWVENNAWAIGSEEQKFFPVNNDSSALLTIPANSSGNARIDLVCVKVDPSASPGDDGAPNCSYVVVQGTPAGSPTPPAVPALHTVLAQIAVANGFSTITTGNITDRRVTPSLLVGPSAILTANIADAQVTSAKLDFSSGIWWEELGRHTLASGASTLNLSNIPQRRYFRVFALLKHTSGNFSAGLRLNNDSGNNYRYRTVISDGTSSTSSTATEGLVGVGTSTGNYIDITIFNPAGTANAGYLSNAVSLAATPGKRDTYGTWNNTAAINRITLVATESGSLLAGSEMVVLGHD